MSVDGWESSQGEQHMDEGNIEEVVEEHVEETIKVAQDFTKAVQEENVAGVVASLKAIGLLLKNNDYIADILGPVLKGFSKVLHKQVLMETVANILRGVANIIENPRFLQTSANTLNAAAAAFDNEVVNQLVRDVFDVTSQILENEFVHSSISNGAQMLEKVLESEEGKEASKFVQHNIIENKTVQGALDTSLKAANAVLVDERVHAAAQSVLTSEYTIRARAGIAAVIQSDSVKKGIDVAQYVCASDSVQGVASGISSIGYTIIYSSLTRGINVAQYLCASESVQNVASGTVRIATSSPVKSSLKLTGKATVKTWECVAGFFPPNNQGSSSETDQDDQTVEIIDRLGYLQRKEARLSKRIETIRREREQLEEMLNDSEEQPESDPCVDSEPSPVTDLA
mmetsp:Transcript_17452/g.28183  ORF Transcript_17452/g.28183 Transcript_17452/m.28183 type:complete len:399 (-) Transcript_17452:992-2188(-)